MNRELDSSSRPNRRAGPRPFDPLRAFVARRETLRRESMPAVRELPCRGDAVSTRRLSPRALGILSILFLSTVSLSLAQTVDPNAPATPSDVRSLDEPFRVEPVTVTATRTERTVFETPQSVSVVSGEEIIERGFATTPLALGELPGVSVQQTNQGGGAPFLRGLTGNEILVLVDGVRLNNGTFRTGPNPWLATIDPFSIDRIEVVRGPASVLYGSDAIGGVINVFTRKRESFDLDLGGDGRTHFRYASAAREKTGHVEVQGNARRIGGLVGGTYRDFADLSGGRGIGVQEDTSYQVASGNFATTYAIDDEQRVDAVIQVFEQKNASRTDRLAPVNGDPLSLEFLFDPERREFAYVEYSRARSFGIVDSARVNLNWSRQVEARREITTGNPGERRLERDAVMTPGAFAQLVSDLGKRASVAGERHRLTYGAEIYHDEIKSRRTDVDLATGSESAERGRLPDGSNFDTLAAYLQDDIQWTDRVSTQLGTRYSHFSLEADLGDPIGDVDERTDAVTSSVHATVGVAPDWNLVGGVAQAFRTPNVRDVGIFGTFNQGVEIPNADLDPQEALGYEVGVKTDGARVTGSLFLFRTDLRDLIRRVPSTFQGSDTFEGERVFRQENTSRAYVQGVEADARFRIDDHWSVFGNIAWIEGRDTSADQWLDKIPPVHGVAGVRHEWQRRSPWIEVVIVAADAQDRLSPDDQTDPRIPVGGTPGYAVVHARGGVRVSPMCDVLAGIENVFDRGYRVHASGIDAPGTNVVIAVDLRF